MDDILKEIEDIRFYRKQQGLLAQEVHSRAMRLNADLWNKCLNAGYKLQIGGTCCGLKKANALLQKAIKRDGQILFYLNLWVYLFDFVPKEHRHLGLQPEAQYNTHMDQGPTFDVIYHKSDFTIEEIEDFYIKLYDKMDCQPYGD
jgi:hypothetical protein